MARRSVPRDARPFRVDLIGLLLAPKATVAAPHQGGLVLALANFVALNVRVASAHGRAAPLPVPVRRAAVNASEDRARQGSSSGPAGSAPRAAV